jgi:glycosyltransferase involved in cell wall biosynthesis
LFQSDTILTNSEWTSQRIYEHYGYSSEIVYPPIADSEFCNTPWEKRESGFLSIGRIEPSKNILQNIRAIRSLRESGYDVHLHIIGPRGNRDYFEKVKNEASKDNFILLDGELSRENLVNMMCTHKFGLQGRMETFGIVIAEMKSAGIIPFVPDKGGQLDIIGSNSNLMYSTKEELNNKIESLLDNPKKIDKIRRHLSQSPDFSKDNFKHRLNKIINRNL